MKLPSEPVTLTVEQLAELNRQLSAMRHDINNHLALILAASELLKLKPELAERMQVMLHEQPGRIGESMTKFTSQFEQALGIKR
jgi:hypothetical protein